MSDSTTRIPGPTRALQISLWLVQVLLGVAFFSAGFVKLTMPIADLAAKMVWPGQIPAGLVRFIGASELAGGLGLILPSVTRIRPRLTPLAALGLMVVMALAAAFHLSRGEGAFIVPNIVLGGLAAFVAWGRGKKAPIPPR